MSALIASIRKETLLLIRDWHALLVLFLMPSLFIVIMSLALQEQLGEQPALQLSGWLQDNNNSRASDKFIAELDRQQHLSFTKTNSGQMELSTKEQLFALTLTADFDAALEDPSRTPGMTLRFAPELAQHDRLLINAVVQDAFAHFNTTEIAESLGYDRAYAEQQLMHVGFIQAEAAADGQDEHPNAVQQSVPAWLIFAMFFIAIPISTTVIQERQQRTLTRLRTFGVSMGIIYSAKLVPYFLINQLQLILMLALGAFLLPLLGADGLSLRVQLPALFAIGCATSAMALALASLIAALARTLEQATAISGAINILLAAIGGIMIPTFVMPPLMQTLAQMSPMNWALEGFLAVLVRGGSWADIAGPCTRLLVGALILWLISTALITRGKHDV
ncbi:ABC transporter permease [Gilvimarinus polysaccharolyticus]|uniref:ABC transporter permease n=1 Tax=Gilvimarinus polysaccharolyticus TaxID=863921 RepID=UPI000673BD3B|nr:ABC transporter permease [Gilvimarinus polysaccharolyticus]